MDSTPSARSSSAVKLLVRQLSQCTQTGKTLVMSSGLEFGKVWVQGHVCSADGNSFELEDGTGVVRVCTGAIGGLQLPTPALGGYCLVAGKPNLKRRREEGATGAPEADQTHSRAGGRRRKEWQVQAHKVKVLQDAPQRAGLWRLEVEALHEHTYTLLQERSQTPLSARAAGEG
ncbi:hypothetical protein TSOC_002966 [Tetrabaena socialis]|uniref:Uncharacterized protein n=1 Tax=Tetrabaena socialis TaxID=47790 RepID=A0A2J8ACR6_9CHLO|nr:hypothetical protein TSOC_002966 [Tetrabaena socialis]|eukprot:PNH10310.1 hypothetical protein TSOC_002966 [Tetrabaena socialis]